MHGAVDTTANSTTRAMLKTQQPEETKGKVFPARNIEEEQVSQPGYPGDQFKILFNQLEHLHDENTQNSSNPRIPYRPQDLVGFIYKIPQIEVPFIHESFIHTTLKHLYERIIETTCI